MRSFFGLVCFWHSIRHTCDDLTKINTVALLFRVQNQEKNKVRMQVNYIINTKTAYTNLKYVINDVFEYNILKSQASSVKKSLFCECLNQFNISQSFFPLF